jgi:putative ABC transport system permease protein
MYGAGSTLRLQEYNLDIKAFQAYPLGWHLQRPGVQAASMALRLESTNSAMNTTGDGSTTVNILGIDPATLQNVMWFRSDFAAEPLPRLLEHVATTSATNAIVSDTFLGATGLHLGDSFDIMTSSGRTIHGRVAAHAAYFPTLDPTQYPFVIFNVNYLNRAIHGRGPSEAWIKTRADPAYVATMLKQFRAALPREVFAFQGVPAPFNAGDDPLRAGVYGVVSVGFLIAMLLALLGFLTYASLALQHRVHEFAVLRALGLSPGQLRWLLLGEHLFMLAAGICGGLVSGILTSRLFLPYLPLASTIMPPFLIAIPWGAVEGFLAAILIVFILVLSVYAGMLIRLPLSRVLRLGEG